MEETCSVHGVFWGKSGPWKDEVFEQGVEGFVERTLGFVLAWEEVGL